MQTFTTIADATRHVESLLGSEGTPKIAAAMVVELKARDWLRLAEVGSDWELRNVPEHEWLAILEEVA